MTFLLGHSGSMKRWQEILRIEIFPQIILALAEGKSLSVMHLTGLLPICVTEIDFRRNKALLLVLISTG